ncbi:hypothetical protein I302_100539 [Kwoniella bestiolae CBS 10118]|uniref:TECPR1-like DysF domain-containing protein n=1 Tax=Kwoniella bestiolae CBS 10118 TaxID=1296100 RepID=A0A1B9G5D2_9TREE|nr:hypothetical protein I302_03914 [Kwoniella bestiolae CBS 10118]OCF26235.1 hypothetical protein I302_03914 [Kwoniella bestiolae CBS 10118]
MSDQPLPHPSIPPHLLTSIPTSAIPIPPPETTNNPSNSHKNVLKSNVPSFPPTSSTTTTQAPKKSSTMSMSLPTNVSDLLLSSLLPPNLPKLPPSAATSSSGKKGVGVPRELSTQRESLSLPLVSNNFRRFMTRVGPIFWLQDRIEEILFWRKPIWTWAWMITWCFICFKPRVLLLLPSLTLILILLHTHEKSSPLPSLLGISTAPPTLTERKNVPPSPDLSKSSSGQNTNSASAGGYSTTTTKDSEGETVEKPTVAPRESESGVDIYMNLQAIQNLMGLVSDGYDYLAPRLTSFFTPNQPISTSNPSNLPLTFTHIILISLPASFLLPLTPSFIIPYLLLPMGIIPPLIFHPNLTLYLLALPSHPLVKRIRAYLEIILLDDKLSDSIGIAKLDKVEVWESQRLDPKLSSTLNTSSSTSVSGTTAASKTLDMVAGNWSSKHLRASDRSPWVKVGKVDTKWKNTDDSPLPSSEGGEKEKEAKMILALAEGWDWVPNEDWRVDVLGEWSEGGVDDEGWLYTDDSWQNPAPTPFTEADTPLPIDKSSSLLVGMNMPGLALRRTTRRRKWWRRVYEVGGEV